MVDEYDDNVIPGWMLLTSVPFVRIDDIIANEVTNVVGEHRCKSTFTLRKKVHACEI